MKTALIAALVCVATIAHADEPDYLVYKVKPGDTIDLVAAEFYGDHARTVVFIVDANKWKTYRKLVPGERIRVPVTREITIARGDTLEALAKQHLGDASRAAYLAEYNNLQPGDLPAAGVVLELPFHITHVAQTTETFAQISSFYFDNAKQADSIRRYNNLGDKAGIERGDTVIVPVMSVHVHAERLPAPDAEALVRRQSHRSVNDGAAAALPAARMAAVQGNYGEVARELGPFAQQLEFLDRPLLDHIGILLGRALVATGDLAAAKAVFAAVLAREPRRALSPYYESPKVIDAWRSASGRVADER